MILCGQIFGELTVQYPARGPKGHILWICKCSCGNIKKIRESHLIEGCSESCGNCNHRELHPLAYKSWDSMKQRCLNPNAPDYSRYGGRGIKISESWRLKFMNFFRDMGDPPIDGITGRRFTLERLDNEGHYCKENCVWISDVEQNRNRSNNLPDGTLRYASGNLRRVNLNCK